MFINCLEFCCKTKNKNKPKFSIFQSRTESRIKANASFYDKFVNLFQKKQKVVKLKRLGTSNSTKEIKKHYQVEDNLIGKGAYAQVFTATSFDDPNQKFAVKIITLEGLSNTTTFQIMKEINIQKKFRHPFISCFKNSYEDEKYIYLVMEYIEGQDLFQFLEEKGNLPEKEVAKIFYKILLALDHIHSQGVIHRDLKLENIMIDEDENPKIIDFGLSKDTNLDEKVETNIVGSKIYMAPEILQGLPHQFSCDIWSLGIILYIMLSGQMPFNYRRVEDEIKNSPILFLGPKWKIVSNQGKNLVLQLLDKNYSKRISTKQALQHQWFNIINQQEIAQKNQNEIDKNIVEQLILFQGMNKQRIEALHVLITLIENQEINNLQSQFQNLDNNQSGCINQHQLQEILSNSSYNFKKDQISKLLMEIDTQSDGSINYIDILDGTKLLQKFLSEEKLWNVFKKKENISMKKICLNDVKNALKELDDDINEQEIEKIMMINDKKNEQYISFKELRNMFFELVDSLHQNKENKDNLFNIINTSYSIQGSDQEERYELLAGKQNQREQRLSNTQIIFEIQIQNLQEKLDL